MPTHSLVFSPFAVVFEGLPDWQIEPTNQKGRSGLAGQLSS